MGMVRLTLIEQRLFGNPKSRIASFKNKIYKGKDKE